MDSQGQITRRDIATLLQQGNVGLARAKAQKLIREDIYGDLLQTLEMLVGVILEHISELDRKYVSVVISSPLSIHISTITCKVILQVLLLWKLPRASFLQRPIPIPEVREIPMMKSSTQLKVVVNRPPDHPGITYTSLGSRFCTFRYWKQRQLCLPKGELAPENQPFIDLRNSSGHPGTLYNTSICCLVRPLPLRNRESSRSQVDARLTTTREVSHHH